MCGIVGISTKTLPEVVQPLVDRLKHRGPDSDGIIQTTAGALGHTRLAILDVAGGQQPMRHGQLWIAYNGEIYNHRCLRQQRLAAATFTTSTDTEVILQLYAHYGPECVAWLDGMFALAIQDSDELFLARDPLGIKPLYWSKRGETLYFASEIKALTPVTSEILEFPPGHWYHTRLGLYQYYRLPTAPSSTDRVAESEQEALPMIRETLRAAVHKRLMADVPLGVSLSGGLDSSIVSLLACEKLPHLHSFAVGVEGSPDLIAAREVASILGTQHHEYVYTEQEMVAVLPTVLYYLESFDPALVRSAIPNYFLARLAANYVKVFLTGEGADELYAGYSYLRAFSEPAALHTELVEITSALHNTNLQRTDRMSMAHGLEARVPFLDVDSVKLAFTLPPSLKVHQPDRPEKALLRRAFAEQLPLEIINRPKAKFSQGAGSSQFLAQRAESAISTEEFKTARARLQSEWHYTLPNKEALYYYRILREHYADEWIFPSLGRSRSL